MKEDRQTSAVVEGERLQIHTICNNTKSFYELNQSRIESSRVEYKDDRIESNRIENF